MNDIKLLGRLAQEPVFHTSTQGRPYVWFIVAVPRKNDRTEADFIRCVAFDKLAGAVNKFCSKGRQILVQGRLQVSRSVDKDTNINRYYHTVVAHAAQFLQEPSLK